MRPERSRLLPLAKIAAACAFALPVAAQPQLDGVWSQVYNWPLIAVHAALTPDGRVLTYGTDGDGRRPATSSTTSGIRRQGLSGGHIDARQHDGHRHLLQLASHAAASGKS